MTTIVQSEPPARPARPGAAGPLPGLLLAALLCGLSACGGIKVGNPLEQDLPRSEAEACRQAVDQEIARQGISQEQVRRVHFQRRYAKRRDASNRITGYDAWVYPVKKGPGAMIVELSESCQVTNVWYRGGSGGRTEPRR